MVQPRCPQNQAPSTPVSECQSRRAGGKSSYATNVVSPRTRGNLSKGYEGKFSSPGVLFQDDTHSPASARPSRKQGVTNFTDPTNPFARALSKQMTRIEDARNDNDRAGARTRNPVMIPRDSGDRCSTRGSFNRSISEDGKHPFIAHSYSTTGDWRPSKRCPDYSPGNATPCSMTPGGVAKTPRCSEGVAASLPTESAQQRARPSALENYLNDMKRCSKSLRNVPANPSADLQRINDERVKLPAERRAERVDANSNYGKALPSNVSTCSDFAFNFAEGVRPLSARIQRSFSCDPRIQRSAAQGEIYEREDNYGFSRKREVSGDWTKSRGNMFLHHVPGHEDPPSSPRRSERLMQKADKRFTEMVTHMKTANPVQRQQFERLKARNEQTAGLISHDPTPRQVD